MCLIDCRNRRLVALLSALDKLIYFLSKRVRHVPVSSASAALLRNYHLPVSSAAALYVEVIL
jgi:hypothetical protein